MAPASRRRVYLAMEMHKSPVRRRHQRLTFAARGILRAKSALGMTASTIWCGEGGLRFFGFEFGRPVGEMIERSFVRAVELQWRH